MVSRRYRVPGQRVVTATRWAEVAFGVLAVAALLAIVWWALSWSP